MNFSNNTFIDYLKLSKLPPVINLTRRYRPQIAGKPEEGDKIIVRRSPCN